jgi:hypothetical protein
MLRVGLQAASHTRAAVRHCMRTTSDADVADVPHVGVWPLRARQARILACSVGTCVSVSCERLLRCVTASVSFRYLHLCMTVPAATAT